MASRRPNQLFGQIRTITNDETANYHGLSVALKQRMTHRVQFMVNYTWSHALDVSSDSNNGGAPMNPYNWRADYASSNWDLRHRMVASFVYDIPFFKTPNPVLKGMFANWQMNGVFSAQTGFPFNVTYGTDTANTSGGGTNRPNVVGTASSDCGGWPPGRLYQRRRLRRAVVLQLRQCWSQFAARAEHGQRRLLTCSRISPSKNSSKIQFRAEFFNFLNHPNFSNPSATFGTGSFGNITSTSTENRDIQFGLRVSF